MTRILDFNARDADRTVTVASIRALKGSGRQFVQVTAGTAEEAAAALKSEVAAAKKDRAALAKATADANAARAAADAEKEAAAAERIALAAERERGMSHQEAIYEAAKHKAVAEAWQGAMAMVFKPNAVRETVQRQVAIPIAGHPGGNGMSPSAGWVSQNNENETITREDA